MKPCKCKRSICISAIALVVALVLPVTATAQKKKRSFLDKVIDGVEKTSEVIDGVLGEPSKTNAKPATKSQTTTRRVTGTKVVSPHPDLQIKLVSCRVHGTTAWIEMLFTSLKTDAEFAFSTNFQTDAYDDQGNQYSARQKQFAFSFGNQSFTTNQSKTKLPQGVAVKCRAQIYGVPEEATVFSRINLHGFSREFGSVIALYNIPIERPVEKEIEMIETTAAPATGSQLTAAVANEDFEAFMDEFIGNPQFQMSRIIWPLEGVDREGNEWSKEDWNIMKIKASSYKNNTEPNQYKYDKKMSGNICREKIYLEDTNTWFEYTYIRKEGKWYLKKAVESM